MSNMLDHMEVQPASDSQMRSGPDQVAARTTGGHQPTNQLGYGDTSELGLCQVLMQVHMDLFGTKDVQNAITASYVWLADQLGHLTLGLVPMLLTCWGMQALGARLEWRPVFSYIVMMVFAAGIFLMWRYKERNDFANTWVNAGGVFRFDASDIVWNVRTALLFFGIGDLLGLCAFLNAWLFLGAFVVSLWPATMVAYWWLRRKLAFQQAGLPYLYRLANFTGAFDDPEKEQAIKVISGLCDYREEPISTWHVLLGHDPIQRREPQHRHILLTGPLKSGKSSLAVGIGTEFSFVLGLARYISGADLIELSAEKPEPQITKEYNDGRVLWPWNRVKLLIVDDLDAGVWIAGGGPPCSLVRPENFLEGMRTESGQETPLAWLRDQRSVWVIGDPSRANDWRDVLSKLMGVCPGRFVVMNLSPRANA